MIKVDVVIPVYNGQAYIQKALESVLNQSLLPSRIIVANDGSTDQTKLIVERLASKHNRIDLLNLEHRGLSATRNAGIRKSESDYIAFLDCDDYWHPLKLEFQVKHLESHSNCKAVFSNCFVNDEITNKIYELLPKNDITFSYFNLLTQKFRVMGSASSICVNLKALIELGYFDETMSYGEDYDFWVRLAGDHKICEVKDNHVYITKRKNSMQQRVKTGNDLFKNANMYFYVWNKNSCFDRDSRKYFERLIAPDIVRGYLSAPLQTDSYIRSIKTRYPAIGTEIFGSTLQILRFQILAFSNSVIRVIKLLVKR